MIIRENYLKKIRGFYQSDLVKVIQGIRRCGKSIILETIKNEIEKISESVLPISTFTVFLLFLHRIWMNCFMLSNIKNLVSVKLKNIFQSHKSKPPHYS